VPFEVRPTTYGVAGHRALGDVIATAKRGDVLAPVTVVVPSNHVGVAARRHLAASSGLAGVTFLTVFRLAELLGAAALAGQGRRPVSNPVLLVAVQEELAAQPGVFAAVRDHPATEEALVRAHAQLADLSSSGLDRLARASPQAAEVVRLHRAVKRRLDAWFDEADLMDSAVTELARGHPVAADLGAVVVFLPQQFSRRGAALLAQVATRVPVTLLPALTGHAGADEGVLRSLRWMGVAEPDEGGGGSGPPARAGTGSVRNASLRVLTTSDADEEARAAVRVVVDAAHRGIAFERMAIVHPADDHYAALVHHHLGAAGLPVNGAAPDHLADRVAGRTVLGLLRLAGRAPSRDEVFSLVAGAPLRQSSGRLVPGAVWERLSREAGIVGATGQEWDDRLTRLAVEREEKAKEMQADDREAAARRLRREAEQALALRDFVHDVGADLGGLATTATWAALAAATLALLDRYLGRHRDAWPVEEREAAEKVEGAIGRLGHLDAVAPGADLARFERALTLELDADLGRRGRFGDGVLLGPVSLLVGLELDLVVLLGLAEGTLPTRQRDDALLPDRDRVAVADELPVAADRQRREQREVLAALAAGGQEVVVSVPRGDLRRTTEHVASRWLLDLVADAEGVGLWSDELFAHSAPWLTHVESFAAGVASAGRPATAQEARLRVVLGGGRLGDTAVERARRALAARAGPVFTEFDGLITGVAYPTPTATAQVVSATRLETWAGCPYAYFVRYLLGIEPVENPEKLLDMSALEQGTLVHTTLERYVSGRLGAGTAGDPPDLGELRRCFELTCRDAEGRGVTGRPLLWRHQRERIWAHLEAFVHADAKWSREVSCEPLEAEMRFGFEGGPLAVTIPGPRTLRFRGSADRVDSTAAGELVVTDYKYSSTYKYQELSQDNPTASGSLLQLPIYALAARERHARGRLPLPVLARYAFAKVGSDGRLPKDKALVIDDATQERWRAALAVIVDGIEAGLFPARPADDATRYAGFISCPSCDPDGLGTADVRRRWNQLQQAPELAGYVALLGLELDDEAEEVGDA
jgi:RecB family exonuclease